MVLKREHADWAMGWQVEEVDTSSMSRLFVSTVAEECVLCKARDVQMQMGDAVQYDHPMHLFIDTFSQDQSCVK